MKTHGGKKCKQRKYSDDGAERFAFDKRANDLEAFFVVRDSGFSSRFPRVIRSICVLMCAKKLIFRMFDDSTGSDKENTAVLFHNTGKTHLSYFKS